MEQRIERLEQTTSRHDDQIATLFSKVDDVNPSFVSVTNGKYSKENK
jgi:hypothetical protein